MAKQGNNYYEITQPAFQDTISDLAFADGQRYLAATSWEGLIYVWEFNQDYSSVNQKKAEYRDPNKNAFMRCCFNSDCNNVYFGTSLGDIMNISLNEVGPVVTPKKNYDATTNKTGPIVGLRYCSKLSTLVALTMDKNLLIFKDNLVVIQIKLTPICMDISDTQLYIATLGPAIWKLDLEKADQNSQLTQLPTSLCYQIRSLSVSQNKPDRYIVGSIFGQVEIVDGQNRKILPCHREENSSAIFPSNSVAMVGDAPCAISAGGNGVLKMINFEKQKGARDLKITGCPLTGVAVSPRGEAAAVAQGYDWQRGAEKYKSDPPKIALYIKKIVPQEFN
ncbi:hypothetical protein M9Y10_034590 [Tritrichomonas musculus]|uniref:Uncharacterized protein n=1 Tax=Tritrichomonas musculus TaxID=1915356 RepID=A0ABR2KGH4_9EUKA